MSLASLLPFHFLLPDMLLGGSSAVEWEDVKLVLALKSAAPLLILVPSGRACSDVWKSLLRVLCGASVCVCVCTEQPGVAVGCMLVC